MTRFVACVAVTLMMAGVAYSQSLGDVARQNREAKANRKSAAHVYTNDEIPSVTVVRQTPELPATTPDASAATPATDEKKAEAKPAAGENKTADNENKTVSAADARKADEAQKARVAEQRKAVELLQREFEVAQREHQIQTAVFYTDAGTRLRNPKDWTEKQKKYQDEMATKSKALDEAKQKLEQLEEGARRSGPASANK